MFLSIVIHSGTFWRSKSVSFMETSLTWRLEETSSSLISQPFQTVLFALDIIDFDLSRMLLSSTVIPNFRCRCYLIMIVLFVTRCRLSKTRPNFPKWQKSRHRWVQSRLTIHKSHKIKLKLYNLNNMLRLIRLIIQSKWLTTQLELTHSWLPSWLHSWLNSWQNSWLHSWLNSWLNSWLHSWLHSRLTAGYTADY